MNILFVSAILPYPLYSGGQVRIYNLLKRLSRNHTIHLCSFIRDENEEQYKKFLPFCKTITLIHRGRAWQPSYIVRSLLGSFPFLMSTYNNPLMKKTISSMIAEYSIDLIHLEPGYVWPSLPNTNLPVVVGEHNIEHTIYQGYVDTVHIFGMKQYMNYDVQKLMKWEKIIWSKVKRVIAVSKTDQQFVSSVVSTPVSIVPNGVDEQTFTFLPNKKDNELICLFVGNFRWLQNNDAVQYLLANIWPDIIKLYPYAKLRIVGKEFPQRLRANLHSSVVVVDQAEEIVEEFHRAHVLLAPIRIGGGTKYKILEAMASGTPVITTNKGKEGLPLENGKNCYISEEEKDWVINISNIVGSKKMNNKIVQNARHLIDAEYTWEKIALRLNDAWNHSI